MSFGFSEIACSFCTVLSYRRSSGMMNRIFHRTADEVKTRTLADLIQRVGEDIISTERSASGGILQTFGFDPETGHQRENVTLPDDFTGKSTDGASAPKWSEEDIQNTVNEINASREKKVTATAAELQSQLEFDPESALYVSVDEIGVTRQKDVRKEGSARETKYVQNCVAHIQHGNESYSLTDVDTDSLFKAVLAFLLANNLLKYDLVFFTDGANDLRSKIASFFSFRPYHLFLDWYHVDKKSYEMLSMAIAGNKAKKKEITEDVLGFLWVGNIAGAADYLKSLPDSNIKNAGKLQEYLGYLDRKGQYMPCYAIRKQLGLRTSSNCVEKENDLLVAKRQKHHGMAWTPHGSGALAAIEMIFHNNQASLWFREGQILGLHMPDLTESPAA